MIKLTIRHSIRRRLVDDLGDQHILLGRRSILDSGRLDNRSRCYAHAEDPEDDGHSHHRTGLRDDPTFSRSE